MTLGEKIVALRKSRGLSQEQLAEKLSVSCQAVSKWELNESMPDVEKVVALSGLFGVTTDYLINDEHNKKDSEDTVIITEIKPEKDEKKTKKVLGWVLMGFGVFGIIALKIMSALIETSVPVSCVVEGGLTWYSYERGYGFIPFLKERGLVFFFFLLIISTVVGFVLINGKKVKVKMEEKKEESIWR